MFPPRYDTSLVMHLIAHYRQGTHYKLLGFFKQYDYDDFMEQLFKHQAYCLWTSDQYNFMDGYREWWPEGCTQTDYSANGSYIYTDIKPVVGGKMTLGMYTDASCTQPYTGSKVKPQDVVDNYYGSSVSSHIQAWNEAFGVFLQCQPCKAYTLSSQSSRGYDDDGADDEDGERDNDDNVNGGYFQCNDDAGYTNVNQCMKFQSQTDMEVASYPDVTLASRQGTISRTYAADVWPTFFGEWGFLLLSVLVFVLGCVSFGYSARPPRIVRSNGANQPLMSSRR